MEFDELMKAFKETAGKDIAALSQLTLNQIRDLITDHIDTDQAVTDAALSIVSVMKGRNTQQLVATGLSMVVMGLELLAKDVTVIPTFKEKGESNE